MAGESGVDQIQFGPFCLDANGFRVFRDGADLKLRPQAVRVLKALLEMPGQSIDYEPLLKQAWGTTFVSRHTVAMTVSEMWKTLEEYGSWIGYRRRVGYSLNISRSDDQIPDRLALVGTKDPRRAREACCTAATDPSDHRAFEAIYRMYLMLGMYGARAPYARCIRNSWR
jgi:DNA-binding winged helix-turn-helix (wHTH) protein